jgi:hypothetical protein
MRRKMAVAAATFGIATIGIAAPTQAAELGTPGTKSCAGHTMAYIAQELQDESWLDKNLRGIGGYVRYQNSYGLDWTVADVRSAVAWWCSGAGL